MAKKTTEYCGEYFEVYDIKDPTIKPFETERGYDWDEIFEAYKRPSTAKVGIWHAWCIWCDSMNEAGYNCGIRIAGHSSNFFSIAGSFRDGEDLYTIHITYAHNRIFKHRAI